MVVEGYQEVRGHEGKVGEKEGSARKTESTVKPITVSL